MTPNAPAFHHLPDKRFWLFDMDGTLTCAMHDFDAMRAELGLPPGVPILESLAALDAHAERSTRARLDAMELRMAAEATAQPGCLALLEHLAERGVALGIVTRNGAEIANVTLEACGIDHFFVGGSVISRDCCTPKPAPDGIQLALARLDGTPEEAVMVGDYRFDLESGRNAAVTTVHLDVDNGETWPALTDIRVNTLPELHALVDQDLGAGH